MSLILVSDKVLVSYSSLRKQMLDKGFGSGYNTKYSTLLSVMTNMFSNHDLEDFAEYLGLDYDQFYESYYQLHHDETESDSGEIPLSICNIGDIGEWKA